MKRKILIFSLAFISFTSLLTGKVFGQCQFTPDPSIKNIGDVNRGSNISFTLQIQDDHDGVYTYSVSFSGVNWASADPNEFDIDYAANPQIVNISGVIPNDDYFGAHSFEVTIQDKNNGNNYFQISISYNVLESWGVEK